MKGYIVLSALLLLALLAVPSVWPASAQATETYTPTPTDTPTATATSTITATPAIVITGVTSNNQGYEVTRYISAGDVAHILVWLLALGLLGFWIFLQLKDR